MQIRDSVNVHVKVLDTNSAPIPYKFFELMSLQIKLSNSNAVATFVKLIIYLILYCLALSCFILYCFILFRFVLSCLILKIMLKYINNTKYINNIIFSAKIQLLSHYISIIISISWWFLYSVFQSYSLIF